MSAMAARRMVAALGSVILVAGLLAGCQLGGSAPTTTVSLAHDQAVVDHWQAVVSTDLGNLQNAQSAAGPCAGTPTHVVCTVPTLAEDRALTASGRALTKARFQLKVAQDQLKKDEG
jgi:hypothetical protein